MTTTGNPWDDDPQRPRRVRIRQAGRGEADSWRGPDGPAPRPPDRFSGVPAPAPYGLGDEPPAGGQPGYAYPSYVPEASHTPAYQGGSGNPYPEADGAPPDLSTGYLYVSRGGPAAEPPPDYVPYDPPELYSYERGRASYVPGPAAGHNRPASGYDAGPGYSARPGYVPEPGMALSWAMAPSWGMALSWAMAPSPAIAPSRSTFRSRSTFPNRPTSPNLATAWSRPTATTPARATSTTLARTMKPARVRSTAPGQTVSTARPRLRVWPRPRLWVWPGL